MAQVIDIGVEVVPGFERLLGGRKSFSQTDTSYGLGFDLRAALEQPVFLKAGKRAIIPTGYKLKLPPEFVLQIHSRGDLAMTHGVVSLNTFGPIDGNSRDHVQVILANLGERGFTVSPGSKIAYGVPSPVYRAGLKLMEFSELD